MAVIYRVLKPTGKYSVGDTVTTDQFPDHQRPHQLVGQGILEPCSEHSGMQPTVQLLVSSSVASLPSLVELVEDSCILLAAISRDDRKTAKQIYQDRCDKLKVSE